MEREPGQPQRRVAGVAGARCVADVDLDDRGAAGEDQRLRELLLPDRGQHRLDRGAPVGVEGAPEVGDRDAGEAAQHPVDQARGQRPAPRVVARGAAAAGHVGAGLDRGDEARNVLRLVLQVAVHRHDDLAARPREARVHGGVLAEVALEAHGVDARVGRVQALDRGPGAVGGAVVDEDQLERPAVERRYGAPVELLDRAFLVQERDDDREGGRVGHFRERSVPAARASRSSAATSGAAGPGSAGAGSSSTTPMTCSSLYMPEGGELAIAPGDFPGGAASLERQGAWSGHGVLQLQRPGEMHAVWVFWTGAERELSVLVRQHPGAVPADVDRLRHAGSRARPRHRAERLVALEGRRAELDGMGRARAAGPRTRSRRSAPRATASQRSSTPAGAGGATAGRRGSRIRAGRSGAARGLGARA